MSDRLLGTQLLPNPTSHCPLARLLTLPNHPSATTLRLQDSASLSTTTPQEAAESRDVLPRLPALQTRPVQSH